MNQPARLEDKAIPFIDVPAQRRRLGRAIDDAIARVLGHCQFILGPEVRTFEAELAAFCGARHAVSCASGTDALVMGLMALGFGRIPAIAKAEGLFVLDDASQGFGATYKNRRVGALAPATATSFFPAK